MNARRGASNAPQLLPPVPTLPAPVPRRSRAAFLAAPRFRPGPALRTAFLKAVAPYDFFYYGISIRKQGLYGEGFKVKESFYKYVTQLVFLNARQHLEEARVFIDASGDRGFRQQINTYLKKRINSEKRHIARVDFLDSAKSDLIQLADMVAGSINRSFGNKPDANNYVRLIRHREGHLQVWPNP